MRAAAIPADNQIEQNRQLAVVMDQERPRLKRFIARQVLEPGDVEDILQDVFYELVAAYRLMKPVRKAGAWLFRVAQNRIHDLFRQKRTVPLDSADGDELSLSDLLPSADGGPDAAYARGILLEELEEALEELPEEQRSVFVAHELDGRSFAELAAETGVSINTLLARKRYAILRLRTRLQEIYDEWEQE